MMGQRLNLPGLVQEALVPGPESVHLCLTSNFILLQQSFCHLCTCTIMVQIRACPMACPAHHDRARTRSCTRSVALPVEMVLLRGSGKAHSTTFMKRRGKPFVSLRVFDGALPHDMQTRRRMHSRRVRTHNTTSTRGLGVSVCIANDSSTL